MLVYQRVGLCRDIRGQYLPRRITKPEKFSCTCRGLKAWRLLTIRTGAKPPAAGDILLVTYCFTPWYTQKNIPFTMLNWLNSPWIPSLHPVLRFKKPCCAANLRAVRIPRWGVSAWRPVSASYPWAWRLAAWGLGEEGRENHPNIYGYNTWYMHIYIYIYLMYLLLLWSHNIHVNITYEILSSERR